MGYKRCNVRTCLNNSYNANKSFFIVTAKYRDSANWKWFCGDENLPDNSYICEDHFIDTDFVNPNNKSQGLQKFAIPSIWKRTENENYVSLDDYCPMDFENEVSIPPGLELGPEDAGIDGNALDVAAEVEISSTTVCGTAPASYTPELRRVNPSIDHDHDYLHDPIRSIAIAERMIELEEREINLKKALRKKSQVLSKKQILIRRLRLEIASLKQKCKSDAKVKNQLQDPILLELQANKFRKCRGGRYSDAMKHLALVLHYCSAKAYKQMRQFFALPSISTIRKWLAKIDVGEGFSSNIFNLLRIKANVLPAEEKLVTIFFDEMAITEKIAYFGNAKPDYFKGFQTKLPGRSEVDVNVRAKSALVIMIKSIRSGFKQSVGYFFCKDMKSEELKAIIDQTILLVAESGFTPKVLVCDQNSVNRALFTKEYNVSAEKPYFEVLIGATSHRIYCMPDAPHLYKSTRNNLLKHNAIYDGGVCSFKHIVDLYWEDVKHTPRTVPGLTYDHIKLSQFAEMNVGLAAQTLSRSVAVGLRAYVRTNKLPKEALFTATYCEDFDALFDAANSSNFNTAKAMKRPLQERSAHWEMMESMVERLKTLKFINSNCFDANKEHDFKPLVKQSRLPYFIEGWLLYIASLKLLWKELQETHGFKFLRTRNLSQDCLEHFFSTVRWKNGNNCHPDCSLFSSAYKSLVINHLILPEKVGNVQADLSKYIINREELSKIQIVKESHVRARPKYLDAETEEPIIPINDPSDVNKLANVHWTTGWACSKLTHKECLIRATAGSDSINQDITFLADLKKYTQTSKIVTPGEKIFQYFTAVCRIFERHFKTLLSLDTVGVKEELMDLIQATFGFSKAQEGEVNDRNEEDVIADNEKLIMDVLCETCALRITNKYLNMLIACKLGEMNSSFKDKDQSKRKSKKNDKAKKLNIVAFSTMLTPTPADDDGYETKKKTFSSLKATASKPPGRPKKEASNTTTPAVPNHGYEPKKKATKSIKATSSKHRGRPKKVAPNASR